MSDVVASFNAQLGEMLAHINVLAGIEGQDFRCSKAEPGAFAVCLDGQELEGFP